MPMKLICYLSNGYPTIESSQEMAKRYVEAGCDVIELDFPSHDPFLEGDLIRNRMEKALAHCADFEAYMQGMREIKKNLPNTNFILMAYQNTIEEIGLEHFCQFCVDENFLDLILVGVTDGTVKDRLMALGIRVSCYVQFDLQPEEVEHAKNSNGFVYMQGKPTTGRINPDHPTLADCITYLRQNGITAPIYCGVGIHTPEDVTMAKNAGADGVFIGSTILKLHENVPEMQDTIRLFKSRC